MEEEKTLLKAVLCFLIRGEKVLLGFKTQKIGKDCWNGYGGGIEPGESPEESALREIREEAKIIVQPENLKKVAIVDFDNEKSDKSSFICRVHVYLAFEWTGEPQSTKTMINPTWFLKNRLPLDQMMPADKIWLPLVLNGKKIRARARYGPFQKFLLGESKIEEVDSFSE